MNNGPTVKRGKVMRATALSASAFSCVAERSTEIVTPSRIYMASGDATGGSRTALPHLTRRQLEVLALLCEGLPNKLICRELDISAGTVKAHISSILRELGVGSRLQAVVEASRRGLLGANGEGSGQPHPAGRGQVGGPISISFGQRAAANRSSHGQPGE
jgi:DNA-binding CsgD family transcriptional regulator